MRRATLLLTLLPLLPIGLPARAAMPDELTLPLDCEPGRSCWVVQYVDHDPGPGTRDYLCGAMTSDGQKGTDIAIRDLRVMAEGVAGPAAASSYGKIEDDARQARRGLWAGEFEPLASRRSSAQ